MMIKRTVLYARVSGDDRGNEGRNLEGQLDMCRDYALRQGWCVVAELAEDDRGASGASFELPQLDRVRKMAESAEFDVLVVREIDRLSRNLAKQLIVEEELRRAGVQIEYALGEYPDTPEGRLNKHIRATIAEFEREKIVERMTRGRRLKVKKGSVMVHGRPPYGYVLVEVDGKTFLEIYEPEAEIVRLVFHWYVRGCDEKGPMSIYGITNKLNEMGVPTFSDSGTRKPIAAKQRGYGKWARSPINRMLRNETYAGVWRYGKMARENGQWVENPEEHLLVVEVPAIVSRDMWEAAQLRLIENRNNGRCNRKYDYLLSRRATCGTCGLKMTGCSKSSKGKIYLYYRCPGNTPNSNTARECDLRLFRADHVDAVVWAWVRSLLVDPDELLAGLKAYQDECELENEPLRQRLNVVDGLLSGNRAQLQRLIDLYLSGDFRKEDLVDRKDRLEATIYALEKERDSLASSLEIHTLTDDQIQIVRNLARNLGDGLEVAEEQFALRRRIIEMLDVQATLSIEDGQKIVYVRCMLDEECLSVVPQTTGSTCRSSRSGTLRPVWLPRL
ncbi:MAG: recombinase family protein [Anaerolineae bacterium]|nr:recombinase family protein [Anaerolineae bacterium]